MTPVHFDVNDAALRDAFLRFGFLEALEPLAADQRPEWGQMSAQQMVEHLVWTFELSTGRAQVDCPVPEAERERMRAFLHGNGATPHGFMNPVLAEGLPALRHASLPDARAALRAEALRFLEQSGPEILALRTHPLFGPIAAEEWSRTHYKHCTHHLLQFGLLSWTRA